MAEDRLCKFEPADINACGSEWQEYKRLFEIHLDAKGLYGAEGRQKVGQLLKCMGQQSIAIYDSFTWAPAVPAIQADQANGVAAQAEIPGEDKYNLQTVFRKFDAHFGVHRYRSIKRQEFFSCTRGPNQSIQHFIAELKNKAKHCEYGNMEEGFIVDMIGDDKCTEKLMELPDRELTLNNAIRICRQVELTNAHLKSLNNNRTEQHIHQARSAGSNRGRGRGRGAVRSRGYQETNQYCTRCCRAHGYGECRAYHRYCGTCGEKGHFTRSTLCRYNTETTSTRGPARGRGRGNRGRGSRGRGQFVQHTESHNYEHDYDDDMYNADICEQFDNCRIKRGLVRRLILIL